MKLLKLESSKRNTVFVNPESITAIEEQDDTHTLIYLSGNTISVIGNVFKITEKVASEVEF